MDRQQQNDNDILKDSKSRFSQEERARMSRENLRQSFNADGNTAERRTAGRRTNDNTGSARGFSQGNNKNGTAKKAESRSSDIRNSGRNSSAGKKEEGSRNDRMKKSSEARRKSSKIKSNTFFAVLLVVIAFIGVFVAAMLLKINVIEVTGNERYSDKTILEAARLDTSDSILLLNTGYLEKKLEQMLPYIEKAEIKREWPDKVIVTVTDAVPSLAIDTGEGYVLMNNSFKVLDTDSIILPADAALIKGMNITEAEPGETVVFDSDVSMEDFDKLIKAFDELGLEGVSEYDLTSVSNIVLTIDHRIEVVLGTLGGADERLAFGKYVIQKTIEENPDGVFVVNVSADGKAYVRDKYDNNVNFDEPSTEETTIGEVIAGIVEGNGEEHSESTSEEETALSFG